MRIILTLPSLLVAMTAFGNERSDEELVVRTAELAKERGIFYPDYRGAIF